MKLKLSKPLWQAVALGLLAGMRSASAPAIAGHILSNHQSRMFGKSPLGFMQSKNLAIVLKIFAAGELIADKLPNTPNRTQPAGVVFRCLSGSLAGTSIFKASGNSALTGALVGSIAALGSTYVSYLLRKNTVAKFKIFDPIVGAVEDGLVLGVGIALVQLA